MDRTLLLLSGVMGFLGVALGAFGAHGLKKRLAGKPDEAQRHGYWQTAAQYHLIHALSIGLAAAVRGQGAAGAAAGWLFFSGIVLFSGSLYVMTLTGIRALGAVTPLGGLLFLGGWVAIGVAALQLAA